MKRPTPNAALSIVALAALIGGCAQYTAHGPYQPREYGESSSKPEIRVTDGGSGLPTIMVSPRTLTFGPDRKPVDIVWSIPKAAPGAKQFTFVPGTGIEIRGEVKFTVVRIEGKRDAKAAFAGNPNDVTFLDAKQDQIVDCKITGEGLQFKCTNKNGRPGLYKYSVQLTDGKDSFVIDPQIENW